MLRTNHKIKRLKNHNFKVYPCRRLCTAVEIPSETLSPEQSTSSPETIILSISCHWKMHDKSNANTTSYFVLCCYCCCNLIWKILPFNFKCHSVGKWTVLLLLRLLLLFPSGVARIFIFIVLLLLCVVCVFPCQQQLRLLLAKGGHGVVNVRNDLNACCEHENETGTDVSAQVFIRRGGGDRKSHSPCLNQESNLGRPRPPPSLFINAVARVWYTISPN